MLSAGNLTSCPLCLQAKPFPSKDEVQGFLLKNPETVIGAVHFIFDEDIPTKLQGFLIQTNTTVGVAIKHCQEARHTIPNLGVYMSNMLDHD